MIAELVIVPVNVVVVPAAPVEVYISFKAQNCNAAPTPVVLAPAPERKSLVALASMDEQASHGYVRGDAGADNAKRERQDASV